MIDDKTCTIRFHAMLRDVAGVDRLELDQTERCTPRTLFERAIERHPGLEAWRDVVAFGTDTDLLPPDAPLPADVRWIHVLPPVSGG